MLFEKPYRVKKHVFSKSWFFTRHPSNSLVFQRASSRKRHGCSKGALSHRAWLIKEHPFSASFLKKQGFSKTMVLFKKLQFFKRRSFSESIVLSKNYSFSKGMVFQPAWFFKKLPFSQGLAFQKSWF